MDAWFQVQCMAFLWAGEGYQCGSVENVCVFSDVSLLCQGEEEVIQVFFLNKTIRVYYSKLHCIYQEARCHMLLQHNMEFLALPAEMTSVRFTLLALQKLYITHQVSVLAQLNFVNSKAGDFTVHNLWLWTSSGSWRDRKWICNPKQTFVIIKGF